MREAATASACGDEKLVVMQLNNGGGWRRLRSLARDTAGNTIAMTAAALMPLIAMVGAAVDLSRLYLVQSRLQSACDAGALAARRSMNGL